MAFPLFMLAGASAIGASEQKLPDPITGGGPIPFAYNTCPNYPTDYSNEHSRPAFRTNSPGDLTVPTADFFDKYSFDSYAGIDHDPNDPSTCPYPAWPGPGRSPVTSHWAGSRDFHRDRMDPQYYYMTENIPQRTGTLRSAEMYNFEKQREAEAPRKQIGRVLGESVRDPIESYDRTLFGRKLTWKETESFPGNRYEITHNKEINIEEGTRAAAYHPSTMGPRPDYVSMQDPDLQAMENPTFTKNMVAGQHGFIHPLDPMPGQPSKRGTLEIDPALHARGHGQFSAEEVWRPTHDWKQTPWEDSGESRAPQAPGHRATAAALMDRADFHHSEFPYIRDVDVIPQVGHSKPSWNWEEPITEDPGLQRESTTFKGPQKTAQPNLLETSREYLDETGIRTLEVQNNSAIPYNILLQRDANQLAYLDPDAYAFDHRDSIVSLEQHLDTGR